MSDPDAAPSPSHWDGGQESVAVAREPVAAQARQVHAVPLRDAGPSERLDQRSSSPAGLESSEMAPSPEGEFWLETVQTLVQTEAVTALVRELALQSQLVTRDAGRWMLRVERESLTQGGSRDRLCAALRAHGHAIELVVEVGTVKDSPARRLALAAERRQHEAEQSILQDPFVQNMVRDFGAKIVPGSLKALLT
jgi:DNA polymerase-3 subunit gamma/tau